MTTIIALGIAASAVITGSINRMAAAIQERITVARWRRRTLRALNQRRRG
jgi:hypothetical protein